MHDGLELPETSVQFLLIFTPILTFIFTKRERILTSGVNTLSEIVSVKEVSNIEKVSIPAHLV